MKTESKNLTVVEKTLRKERGLIEKRLKVVESNSPFPGELFVGGVVVSAERMEILDFAEMNDLTEAEAKRLLGKRREDKALCDAYRAKAERATAKAKADALRRTRTVEASKSEVKSFAALAEVFKAREALREDAKRFEKGMGL